MGIQVETFLKEAVEEHAQDETFCQHIVVKIQGVVESLFSCRKVL